VTVDRREYRAELPAGASRCNAGNAALAVACARHVAGLDDQRLQRAIAPALAHMQLPGRMEVLSQQPWVVVDGAHTPDSTRALAEMLKGLPARRTHLIVSLSNARNATKLLAPLLEHAYRVVVTRADATRSLDSTRVAADLIAGGYPAERVRAIPDPRTAVLETHASLTADDLLCVAGSMYMAGVARETLLSEVIRPRRTR
jgi:dihydrofolate synthase/folylpolyglutamate synthase